MHINYLLPGMVIVLAFVQILQAAVQCENEMLIEVFCCNLKPWCEENVVLICTSSQILITTGAGVLIQTGSITEKNTSHICEHETVEHYSCTKDVPLHFLIVSSNETSLTR